ncbi:hypothetical protein B2G71_09720 [Novosphingobium sp. PC22D]|uniref:MFS transporter n=1 Tax=Novosphingobium sp. PC22D TaxID=1962403 RepID=UPI000BEF24F6|nr:MFS transporter [Novosphingobium sp. PC22D]PEQ13087.1 hypothetical protein B2G71_09720 [Novosphingobium sp. PC22D]
MQTTRGEWRDNWPVLVAAMIGFSTLGVQSYAIGPFVPHLEAEYGWSRAEVMLGVSISNAVGIFLNIAIGLIVDRFGSRRIGILGLVVKTGAFALLGTATGSLLNWSLLWVFVAIGIVLVQATVWTRVIASRFDRSRGFAMALTLSGTSLTAIIAPVLATALIAQFGWRGGFFGFGAVWLAATLPPVFFLFRDAPARHEAAPPTPRDVPGLTFREGIRTHAFARLMISFGCFSFFSMTMATNLIPLLLERGAGPMQAGQIASIMGLCGLASRLTVGFLLDRFPGHVIGAVTLLLPVLGAAIFLLDQPSIFLLAVGVSLFGAAIGAEIDVALYLGTRHFGLKAFASLFGGVISFGAVNAAIGPFVAGALHDRTGNYDSLLAIVMAVMSLGALAMLTMRRPRGSWQAAGERVAAH